MAGNQIVIVSGNMTKKGPEMRYSDKGNAFTTFSISVQMGWGDSKESILHNCICFGKTAEFVAQNFHGGSPIFVTGTVKPGKPWTDKDGNEVKTLDMTVSEAKFGPSNDPNPDQRGNVPAGGDPAGDGIPF